MQVPLIPLLTLTAVAFAVNMLPLSLAGIDFLFGGIFVFVVLRLYGTTIGVVVALVASSYTLVRWGHPLGMVNAGIEALAVGLLVQRRRLDLPLATLVFWLPAGLLLVVFSYQFLLDYAAPVTWLIALKQSVNATSNALLAAILLDALPLWRWLGTASARPAKFIRRQQSHLLAGAVLFPLFAGLLLLAWHEAAALKMLARQRILDETRQLQLRLDNWQRRSMATAAGLVDHLATEAHHSPAALRDHLQTVAAVDPEVAAANLTDAAGKLLASSQDNVGRVNLGDRPWFRTMRATGKPLVSDVLLSRTIGVPAVIAAAPLFDGPAANGKFRGAVTLVFQLNEMHGLIGAPTATQEILATVLDGEQRTIVSNRPGVAAMQEFVQTPEGIVIERSDGLTLSRPANGRSPLLSWQDARYQHQVPLAAGGWSVALDLPLRRQIDGLHDTLRLGLAAALLLTLATLLGGRWAAGRISRPLEQLSAATTRLADGHPGVFSMPASGLAEMDTLTKNFHRMAEALARSHAELEQRVAERTAELEQQKAAVDQHAIVSIANAAGDIVAVNDKFCAISGYARAELLGKNHRMLNSGRQPRQFFDDLWASIAQGRTWHGLICNRAKNGTFYWVHSTIVPFVDGDGIPYQYVAIRTDVTPLIATQAALNAAMTEAEAASRAKSLFLANVSHEMRTPMNAILGFGQVLQGEALNAQQAQAVEHIVQAGEGLMEIIEQVLTLADIESGNIALAPETVELGRLMGEIMPLLDPLFGSHQVAIECQQEDGATAVRADRARFTQVMFNLLSNAIKFNHAGGTVCARWERRGDRVRISVADSGPGIPLEKQPYLFTPFNRLGKESLAIRGTGIGLVISKNLVQMMGGSIGFESAPDVGSTFWVELPAA